MPLKKRSFSLLFLFPFLFSNALAEPTKIFIDQTVAVVGKRVLTLRDVEAYFSITSLLESHRPPEKSALRSDPELFQKTRQSLIRNTIVLNYLENTDLIQTTLTAVNELKGRWKGQLQQGFPSVEAMREYFKAQNLSEADLDTLLTDRARVECFVEKELGSRVTVNEGDIKAYYEEQKEKRFLGKPYESVAHMAKIQAQREKLKKEFEKWIETETKRTEINLIPLETNGG